jgi:hypothetical protein
MYVQENKTWEEAVNFCQLHGRNLSDVGQEDLKSIQTCQQNNLELWTASYIEATPYLSLIGQSMSSITFSALIFKDPTLY